MPTTDTDRPRHGRLRAAWSVLRGEMTTPAQIRAEWIEYQVAFDGIFDRLSTALARIAKREQRAAKAALEAAGAADREAVAAAPQTKAEVKAQLRRRVGLTGHSNGGRTG